MKCRKPGRVGANCGQAAGGRAGHMGPSAGHGPPMPRRFTRCRSFAAERGDGGDECWRELESRRREQMMRGGGSSLSRHHNTRADASRGKSCTPTHPPASDLWALLPCPPWAPAPWCAASSSTPSAPPETLHIGRGGAGWLRKRFERRAGDGSVVQAQRRAAAQHMPHIEL